MAQEFGCGERMDELFAGTPSPPMVKMLMNTVAGGGYQAGLMLLDVKFACLCGRRYSGVYHRAPRTGSS